MCALPILFGLLLGKRESLRRPWDVVRSGDCPNPQRRPRAGEAIRVCRAGSRTACQRRARAQGIPSRFVSQRLGDREGSRVSQAAEVRIDRKSTRLNSSHMSISYAVFCLKKKKNKKKYLCEDINV